MIDIDLRATHHVVAASNHTYLEPTQELFIKRTLAYHEIIYLDQGEWTYVENINDQDVVYDLKPQSMLILTAGEHEFIKQPCTPGTKTYCIHITKEGKDLCNDERNMKIEPFSSSYGSSKINSYFKSACDAFWSEDPFNQAKADAYITLLLCEIAKISNETSLSREVRSIIKLISGSPHKNFSKEELTEASGISYKKLSGLFKEQTGQTLHAYQINKKLEMIALQLDTEPYIRMKELAATYNFYDEFYLSKLFKRKFGVSPQEYKTRNKRRKTKHDTIC